MKYLLDIIQQLRDENIKDKAFIIMIKNIVRDYPHDSTCGEMVRILMKSYLDSSK